MQPSILLTDHSERDHPLDLAWLDQLGQRALPHVISAQRKGSMLAEFDEIEISLVNDDTIAQVHGEFMNLPTPTDVITFHHGEILISIDTAERQARDYSHSWQEEVALYIVHGLLHLAGYKDKTPEDFASMATAQARILADCIAEK